MEDDERLRDEQAEREQAERDRADEAELPTEERAALRRADKHAYLREKLEERARTQREG